MRAKQASFGGLGENFKITVYNDRLYSMRDPFEITSIC